MGLSEGQCQFRDCSAGWGAQCIPERHSWSQTEAIRLKAQLLLTPSLGDIGTLQYMHVYVIMCT